MPFIPTPNVALCTLAYDWDLQHVSNNLWFNQESGEFTVESLTTLATELTDYWATTMMPQLSDRLTFRGVVAYSQFSESAPAVEVSAGVVAGGVAEQPLPNNVAWAVKFNTAGRGKSFRGRNYVPGIPRSAVENNIVDEAFADNILLVYNGILTSGPLAPWSWVVVSHFTGGAPRAAGLASAVLSASFSDLTVDSQRRRLPGRGT